MKRRSLSDILHGSTRQTLADAWSTTEAAGDYAPIPSGTYECRVNSGELFESNRGTPGYKVAFKVLEGECAGRLVWEDLWLTPAALAMSKRDLLKLGITSIEQLEQPLSPGLRATVKVALRRGDDGTERNRVARFDVTGRDSIEDDDFAPRQEGGGA